MKPVPIYVIRFYLIPFLRSISNQNVVINDIKELSRIKIKNINLVSYLFVKKRLIFLI